MRQRFIAGIGIILLVVVTHVFMTPSFWEEEIETILNRRYLNPGGWRVSVKEFSGHLLTKVEAVDVRLAHEDGLLIQIPIVKAQLHIFRSLLFGPDFSHLLVHDARVISVPKGFSPSGGPTSANLPRLRIRDLTLGGTLILEKDESRQMIRIQVDGSVRSDRGGLDLDLTHVQVDLLSDPDLVFQLEDSKIRIAPDHVEMSPVKGHLSKIPFAGNLHYSYDSTRILSGDVEFSEIPLPENPLGKLPVTFRHPFISTRLSFESDLENVQGTITVVDGDGYEFTGPFHLRRLEDHVAIDEVTLANRQSQLILSGVMEKNGRLNGSLNLQNMDVSLWLDRIDRSNLSGLVLYEGLISEGIIQDLSLTLEVLETATFADKPISVSGSGSYHGDRLTVTEPLKVSVGSSYLQITGNADFRSRSMDLQLDMDNAEVFLVNNFWPEVMESGTATGRMKVRGPFEGPALDMNLVCRDIVYKDFDLKELELIAAMDNNLSVSDGYAQIRVGEGTWKEFEFDNGTFDLRFNPETVTIENLHLKSGDDYIQLSGLWEQNRVLKIDRLQLAYEDHYLINTRPVEVEVDGDSLAIKPFVLHVDDGVVEGFYSRNGSMEGRIKFSNVDSKILSKFIDDPRLQATGVGFGEISFRGLESNRSVTADLSLKKGEYMGQSFDDMIVSILIRDDVLHIEELTLTAKDHTGFQVTGILPLKKELNKAIPLNLSSTFTHANVDLLTQFIPDWFYLGGQISGSFSLGGTMEKTEFQFDLSVEDAMFDVLALGKVSGKGSYDGKTLRFHHFTSHKGTDHLEGWAYLPLDYNLGSDSFGSYFMGDSLGVEVRGNISSLYFLTEYLEDVDSINGDMDILLGLSGSPERIIRNGFIELKDASIYTLLLDDPIEKIQGRGEMQDNLLTIRSFTGRSWRPDVRKGRPGVRKSNRPKDNLTMQGTVDFTYFFEPRFDVHIQGKDVGFRTLPLDLEGTADVDVQVVGKDTITVSGEIAANDVIMHQEFFISELGEAPEDESRITMNYKLNFPVQGEFTLRNSQIEALVGGEVSISKLGDYPMDFSGEMYVREGKFYYYQDVFNISEGNLIFDKKGFNPYLDITAYTDIETERISITMTGPLDNPQLILKSDSGISPSDILELLTWGKRFEDQELTSSGFGNQAYSILGTYFESQLEKNLMEFSGLDKLELVDDISISGAAGLINPAINEDFTLTAKRNITDKASLNYSYRRSFSLANPTNSKVGVEYKLNRYFSVVGNVDEDRNLIVKYRFRYAY